MKHKLLSELPVPLQKRVAPLVNLRCSAGPEGLRRAAAHLTDVLERDLQQQVAGSVDRFLDLAARMDSKVAPLVCYGEAQTAIAVCLGAVDQLLIARSALEPDRRSWQDWQALAVAFGATIVEISTKSEAELRFSEGFGIGACLRYPVNPDLLEVEPDDDDHDDEALAEKPRKPTSTPLEVESDGETASTATSQSATMSMLLRWLEEALKRSLSDDATAESLTMCVEVLLSDGTEAIGEGCLDSAVDMLREEGVAEEVLAEFACHVADLLPESQ